MLEELNEHASPWGGEEAIFVCFASFEDRCMGAVARLDKYIARHSYILRITDEPCEKREQAIVNLKSKLSCFGKVSILDTQHTDPIVGLLNWSEEFQNIIKDLKEPKITIDISTFPRRQMFLFLRLLDRLGLMKCTRILYTEPKNYIAELGVPLSFGLKNISIIPTFKGKYDPREELILVLFLGYEGDRALALLENIEPHKTIVVIPKPAFYPEWEGKTEELNRAVLSMVDSSSIYYSHSQDPVANLKLLEELIKPENGNIKNNWYIAPLGTKLQALGAYAFVSRWPDAASIIYSSPLSHNEDKFSKGIGRTFVMYGNEL